MNDTAKENVTKHTAGPWEVRLSKTSFGEQHAVICTPDYPSASGSYVADVTHGMTDPVRKANAHLMAAAPKLLEAAEVEEDAHRFATAWAYADRDTINELATKYHLQGMAEGSAKNWLVVHAGNLRRAAIAQALKAEVPAS